MRGYASDAGRDPDAIGIEGRINAAGRTPEEWRAEYESWQAIGATHIHVHTLQGGLAAPQDHIDLIRRVRDALPEAFT